MVPAVRFVSTYRVHWHTAIQQHSPGNGESAPISMVGARRTSVGAAAERPTKTTTAVRMLLTKFMLVQMCDGQGGFP